MNVLVDTSVWIDLLRARADEHVRVLRALLLRPTVVLISPQILQEVLQGATTREAQSALERRFRDMPCVSAADARTAAIAAARLYVRCRLQQVTPRSSNDCLIACMAIEHDALLLHNDRDFDAIASVEPRLRVYGNRGHE